MSNENLENMRDSFAESLVVLHELKQALWGIADEYNIRSIQIFDEEGRLIFVFCGIQFCLWCVPLRKISRGNSLIRWGIFEPGETHAGKTVGTREFLFTREDSQDGVLRYYTDANNPTLTYYDNPPHARNHNLMQLAEAVIDEMTDRYLSGGTQT